MIFAFYGRKRAGKDTATILLEIAMRCALINHFSKWKYCNFSHEQLLSFLTESGFGKYQSKYCFSLPWLEERFDKLLIKYSFSSKIHEMTSLLCDVPIEQLLDRGNKETLIPKGFDKTVRQLMVDIGEGLRASIGPEVWVVPVINKINANPKSIFLIPGMRHPNEYKAIKSKGGIVIKVVSEMAEVAGENQAEGLLDDYEFDFILENQKDDLTKMFGQICDIVNNLDSELFNNVY